MTAAAAIERAAAFSAHGQRYAELGWVLIRTDGKKPHDDEWQKSKHADPEYIAGQWSRWGERHNMGVVLGPSALAVLEYDKPEARDEFFELLGGRLPETPACRTGRGRGHIYFSNPDAIAAANRDGLELRAGGQQCLLPPSVHPDTEQPYTWVRGHAPWEMPLVPLPAKIIEYFTAARNGQPADPIGDAILEGERNRSLTSLAGSMRRRGASEREIVAAITVANEERCNPPLDPREIERIAASVARYAPSSSSTRPADSQPSTEGPAALTDLGNAELLAGREGHHLRHVKERRQWLVYRDGRWRLDLTGEAERAAKEIARMRLRDAVEIADGEEQRRQVRWAITSQSGPRLREMLAVASSEPTIVLGADELDRDPFLLSCANGTLDLRTGELRAASPDDLISQGNDIVFDPDATCPLWEQSVQEIFDGDEDLTSYFKRKAGYALTGDTREQDVDVLHGSGGNGKDTLIRPIMRIVGEQALTTPMDTFARARDKGVRNDLARLHRARLVIAAESAEGRGLDEATVKAVSGGGSVAARFLYGEFFEYVPQFKVWLVTNHKPRVEGDDDAIWRRLRLIPFNVSFVGREDKELGFKLERELPGILNWALQGCLEWQAEGLGLPSAVESATKEYRADEDVFGSFIAERCTPEGQVPPSELRAAYEHFCTELGERPLAASVVGRRLSKRGIKRATREGESLYIGIGLRQ